MRRCCRARSGSTRRSRSWRWRRGSRTTCSARRRRPTSPSRRRSRGHASTVCMKSPRSLERVDLEQAIRTRRTHKAFRRDPVPRETLDELFELARWAPSHNLTNPWRFRVVGPQALDALKQAAGTESAPKLDRAPTLVVASAVQTGDAAQDEEDLLAVGVACYIVLVAAPARGL